MKPCVLVFAGSDPSGGAGISADIEAIAAQGAHAMPVITVLTVQDNDRVFAVHPVDVELILEQAQILSDKIPIAAIKIGIIGSQSNAAAIASWITHFKKQHANLPVILDPVLASGHGDALSVDRLINAVDLIAPLIPLATVITPNLNEAELLCPNSISPTEQAKQLTAYGAHSVLIKGGHSTEPTVTNHWFENDQHKSWEWQRLAGAFHGSGCTLASAIAGQLACGKTLDQAIDLAQIYCQNAIANAYAISSGQLIPKRVSN